MLIDKEVLAEKNYSGSRLIKVDNPTIKKLQAEVAKFKPQAEPHLAKLEKLGKVLDPARIKIREIQERAKKEVEEVKRETNFELLKEEESKTIEALDAINNKAEAIKNKMQPIIREIILPQLGEFETAREMTQKDGEFFVEVFDEIEEKVKQVRAQRANQNKK